MYANDCKCNVGKCGQYANISYMEHMGKGKQWLFLPGQEPLRSLPQRRGIGLKTVAEVRLHSNSVRLSRSSPPFPRHISWTKCSKVMQNLAKKSNNYILHSAFFQSLRPFLKVLATAGDSCRLRCPCEDLCPEDCPWTKALQHQLHTWHTCVDRAGRCW